MPATARRKGSSSDSVDTAWSDGSARASRGLAARAGTDILGRALEAHQRAFAGVEVLRGGDAGGEQRRRRAEDLEARVWEVTREPTRFPCEAFSTGVGSPVGGPVLPPSLGASGSSEEAGVARMWRRRGGGRVEREGRFVRWRHVVQTYSSARRGIVGGSRLAGEWRKCCRQYGSTPGIQGR